MTHRDETDASLVLKALLDPDQPIYGLDLTALSDLSPEELAQFGGTWSQLPGPRRRELVSRLVELAEEQVEVCFRPIFQWLLADEDARVRAQAIDGLWEDDDVRLVAPLTRVLQADPAADARAAAAQSLGRFVLLGELEELDRGLGEAVEEALWSAYHEAGQDILVRRRALEALGYSSADRMARLIAEAYADEDDGMRASAVFAMGRSADSRWRDIVLDELSSTDAEMRYEAARASGELELAEAVPALLPLLDEADVDLRDVAVWALGHIGGPEARRALEACAASDDEALAEAAQEALDELSFLSGDDELPAFMF
jgi:HEAT repeat protein